MKRTVTRKTPNLAKRTMEELVEGFRNSYFARQHARADKADFVTFTLSTKLDKVGQT